MNYLDANVFLYPLMYENKKSVLHKEFLKKVFGGEIKVCTSFLTWDEIVFIIKKFLGNEIASREGKKFLELPSIVFVKVDKEIMRKAQEMIEKYKLKPRDAIHATSAVVSKADKIISDDSDFDVVKEIKRVPVEKFL